MAGKPTKKQPTPDPIRHLNEIGVDRYRKKLAWSIKDLAAIHRMWNRRMTNLLMLSSPLQSSDTDGVGGGKGGISDPTPLGGEAARWAMRGDEIARRLAGVCAEVTWLYHAVTAIPDGTDTKAEASRHGCTGGIGQDGYDHWRWEGEHGAVCHNIVGQGSTTGLCDRCRQRRDEWRRKQRAA